MKQTEGKVGLMQAGTGSCARSRAMVQVPAAPSVPEAANAEATRVGAMCVTCQRRKKELMRILLSFPHRPLRWEKKPISSSLLGPVCGIRGRLNVGRELLWAEGGMEQLWIHPSRDTDRYGCTCQTLLCMSCPVQQSLLSLLLWLLETSLPSYLDAFQQLEFATV